MFGKSTEEKNKIISLRQKNLYDADYTRRLFLVLREKLVKAPALLGFYRNVELPLCFDLMQMEGNGILLDVNKCRQLAESYQQAISKLELTIKSQLSIDNINSTLQVGKALQEKGYQFKEFTPTGRPSISARSLKQLPQDELIASIIERNDKADLVNDFLVKWPKMVDSNNRLHPEFSQVFQDKGATATGRLSSRNPNLQQVPKDKVFRSLFIARPGYLLIDVDYDQLELRVMAWYAQEEWMLDAFKKGRDVHWETKEKIFGKHGSCTSKHRCEECEKQRKIAKNGNFAEQYGAYPKKFAETTGLPLDRATEIWYGMKKVNKNIAEWVKEQKELMHEKGYTQTLYRRPRYLPNLSSDNFKDMAEAERQGISHIIQGTATELYKVGIVELIKNLPSSCYTVGSIHDEILIEVPGLLVDRVKELCFNILPKSNTSIPLAITFKVGESWYD